jgi:hypothetical protein
VAISKHFDHSKILKTTFVKVVGQFSNLNEIVARFQNEEGPVEIPKQAPFDQLYILPLISAKLYLPTISRAQTKRNLMPNQNKHNLPP